jgi:hypothetical protein
MALPLIRAAGRRSALARDLPGTGSKIRRPESIRRNAVK